MAEKKSASKFKYEGGSVDLDIQDEDTDLGRKDVLVNGTLVGWLSNNGDDTYNAFADPSQLGAGWGAGREVATGVSEKEATQALVDALGEHASVNVLSQ